MLLVVVMPAILTALLFGVVPLGEPNTDDNEDKFVYIFFTNASTYSAWSCMVIMVFWAALDESKPYRSWWSYVLMSLVAYIFQAGIM